jgi:hypothetical protein
MKLYVEPIGLFRNGLLKTPDNSHVQISGLQHILVGGNRDLKI